MNSDRLDLFHDSVPPDLVEAHLHMDALFLDLRGVETYRLKPAMLKQTSSFKKISSLPAHDTVKVIRAAAERAHWSQRESARPGSRAYNVSMNYLAEDTPQHFECLIELFLRVVCVRKLPTVDDDIIHLLSIIRRPVESPPREWREAGLNWWMGASLARLFRSHVKTHGVSPRLEVEANAVVAFLRDPRTSNGSREAMKRKLANDLEFIAKTAS